MKFIKLFESSSDDMLERIKDCAFDITDRFETEIKKVGSSYHININTGINILSKPEMSTIKDISDDLDNLESIFNLRKDIVGFIKRLGVSKFKIINISSSDIKIIIGGDKKSKNTIVFQEKGGKLQVSLDLLSDELKKFGFILTECSIGSYDEVQVVGLSVIGDDDEVNFTVNNMINSLRGEYSIISGIDYSDLEYDGNSHFFTIDIYFNNRKNSYTKDEMEIVD